MYLEAIQLKDSNEPFEIAHVENSREGPVHETSRPPAADTHRGDGAVAHRFSLVSLRFYQTHTHRWTEEFCEFSRVARGCAGAVRT